MSLEKNQEMFASLKKMVKQMNEISEYIKYMEINAIRENTNKYDIHGFMCENLLKMQKLTEQMFEMYEIISNNRLINNTEKIQKREKRKQIIAKFLEDAETYNPQPDNNYFGQENIENHIMVIDCELHNAREKYNSLLPETNNYYIGKLFETILTNNVIFDREPYVYTYKNVLPPQLLFTNGPAEFGWRIVTKEQYMRIPLFT